MPINHQYDIVLNGVGYMLSPVKKKQDRAINGTFVPAELQAEIVKSRDVPVIYDDFSGGMGYSEKVADAQYAWGENVCTRFPRVVIPGPALNYVALPTMADVGQIKASGEYGGDLFFAGGGALFKVAGGAGTATVEWTNSPTNTISLGASFAATSIVVFKVPGGTASMYIGGTGAALWRLTTATYTQASAGGANQPTMKVQDMACVYQLVAGAGSHRIVWADGNDPSQIWSVAADPMVAANAANMGILEGGVATRCIAGSNRHAYFVTDIGIFDLTEQGYSPNYTPYWIQTRSSENGRDALVYNGKVFACHKMGLDMLRISQGNREDVSGWAGPGVGTPNETPIHGLGTALTTDNGWLVYSLWNGTSSYVMYGMERTTLGINGPGPMVWHGAEIVIENEEITHMVTNSLTGSPRLWIATIVRNTGGSGLGKTVNGDINLYYCTIPDTGSPIQNWSDHGNQEHRFATEYTLDTPGEHYGDSAAKKFLKRLDVQADNLGVDRTIEILAHAEDDDTFVSQGTAGGSPLATIYPPNDYLESRRLFLRITGRGTTTNPPILRSLKARSNVKIELSETREYTALLGGSKTRSGALDRRDPKDLHNFLVNLQDSPPIPMQDDLGNEITVIFEQGLEYSPIDDPATGRRQAVDTFVVTVVTRVSETGPLVGTVESIYRYDSGFTWGNDSGVSTNPIRWA